MPHMRAESPFAEFFNYRFFFENTMFGRDIIAGMKIPACSRGPLGINWCPNLFLPWDVCHETTCIRRRAVGDRIRADFGAGAEESAVHRSCLVRPGHRPLQSR